MTDLIRVVWMGKSKPCEETFRDATWAEQRATNLRALLIPECAKTVQVIYPSKADGCRKVQPSAPPSLF